MRPINSEPLLKEIRQLKEKASTFGHPDYRLGYISALSVVEGMIASEDKIDAEPVRHGRWERNPNTESWFREIVFCSECGRDNGARESDYCPNCGTKMDEEAQE